MLFGRKKPGFTEKLYKATGAGVSSKAASEETEENSTVDAAKEAKSREIEQSNASNGKTFSAAEETNKTGKEAATEVDYEHETREEAKNRMNAQGKRELLEYLDSMPDVPDDEMEEALAWEEEKKKEEQKLTPAQELADYIRKRTKGSQLTTLSSILKEVPDAEKRLDEMEKDETCQDIVSKKGEKETYYYSQEFMSDNYAMIAVLVEDKDLPKTVAEMVRFNCKTYPAPTPIEYFERSPYSYTKAQIERAYSIIQGRPEYQDVHAFHNSVGATYFFSEKEMHEKYARSLAEPELFTD